MDQSVFAVVVFAAFLHAALNCGLKAAPDPLAASIFLAIGGGAAATPALLFFGAPPLSALPWLAASAAIHVVYWSQLGKAYATGTVGTVFPMARGLAPVLTMGIGVAFFGERLSPSELVSAAAIVSGIVVVIVSGGAFRRGAARPAFASAAIVACCTMGYTIVDGMGARACAAPIPYVVFLYLANGWLLLAYGLLFQRARLVAAVNWGLWLGPLAGGLSLGIYGAGVWAMTRAPIPLVSALRESSVLFAVVLAVIWLKEPLRVSRMAGAGIIAAGLAGARLL
jgi:drug/metabolite transporter (DMT)-like permease